MKLLPIIFCFLALSIFAQTDLEVVTAQKTGETVEDVAKRYGADPLEVAKLNGLFTNSKLTEGREIKIPKTNFSRVGFPHENVKKFYPIPDFILMDYFLDLKDYLVKDEFETREEYKTRLKFFFSKAKIGKRISKTPPLSIDKIWMPVKPELKYDAENKIFKFEAHSFQMDGMVYLEKPKTEETITLFPEIPIDEVERLTKLITINLSFPMPPADARKNKDELRIAFQGLLVSYNEQIPRGFIMVPVNYAIFNRITGETIKEGSINEIMK